MRRWYPIALLLVSAALYPTGRTALAQAPTGFKDVLNGVESGKKFHQIWVPIVGASPLGVIVRADNPKNIIATFESIEGPDHRNAAFEFARGETRYIAPALEQKKDGGVKVDISELMGVLFPANSAAANSPAPHAATAAAGATNAMTTTPPTSGGNAPGTGTAANSGGGADNLTGIKWSSVSEVKRSGGNVTVEWYSLGTLQAVYTGSAVDGPTKAMLSNNATKVWFMNRVLRFDGLSYDLKSQGHFDAGFAAGLVKWIPGISISRATDTHITLNVTSPVYLGYKLWRPGTDPGGAAAPTFGFEGIPPLDGELGSDEIDALH